MSLWKFTPVDSLLFKESRQMDVFGGSVLQTIFPPSNRSLAGAVRSTIGNYLNTNWTEYNSGKGEKHSMGSHYNLIEIMGNSDTLGRMRIKGPYIFREEERLFPTPANLFLNKDDGTINRLLPGDVVICDRGKIRICQFKKEEEPKGKIEPLNGTWMRETDLKRYLSGQELNDVHIIQDKDLFVTELRTGIARDNRKGVVEKGKLYQTNHLRLRDNVSIQIEITGVPDELQPEHSITRFGAEGRLANVQVFKNKSFPKMELDDATSKRILSNGFFYLTTKGNFANNLIPPSFSEINTDYLAFEGEISRKKVRVDCIVNEKPIREGGYDYARRMPRPVQSLVPAGSVFFTKFNSFEAEELHRIQHDHIGLNTEYGYGEILAGTYNE